MATSVTARLAGAAGTAGTAFTRISNITAAVSEQVSALHQRRVSARYAVVYCDATYLNLRLVFEGNESLFTFYRFPESNRKSIYTSSLIENCNKDLKHHTKLKEQFPNEDSLERFVCSFYCDYNRKRGDSTHRGFLDAEPEFMEMFHPA